MYLERAKDLNKFRMRSEFHLDTRRVGRFDIIMRMRFVGTQRRSYCCYYKISQFEDACMLGCG